MSRTPNGRAEAEVGDVQRTIWAEGHRRRVVNPDAIVSTVPEWSITRLPPWKVCVRQTPPECRPDSKLNQKIATPATNIAAAPSRTFFMLGRVAAALLAMPR